MDTMTDSETYNGYANRETWAFNLHWSNDQGLYRTTLDVAEEAMRQTKYDADPWTDSQLGEYVVSYWADTLNARDESGIPLPEEYVMFQREVGSWWRINYAEVGASVRESLDNES